MAKMENWRATREVTQTRLRWTIPTTSKRGKGHRRSPGGRAES